MKTRRVQRIVDGLTDSARHIDRANKLMVHVTDPCFQETVTGAMLSSMAKEAAEERIHASGILRTVAGDLKGKSKRLARGFRDLANSQVEMSHTNDALAVSLDGARRR